MPGHASSVVGYASITLGPRTTYVMGTSLHPIRIAHAYNFLKACVRETPRLLPSVRRKSPPASLLCFHAYEFHMCLCSFGLFLPLTLTRRIYTCAACRSNSGRWVRRVNFQGRAHRCRMDFIWNKMEREMWVKWTTIAGTDI